MSKKKIAGYINLTISAGKANPSPPVGPALGRRKVNIMDFCNQFNNASKAVHEVGTPIPTVITVYEDNSFTFIMKLPPVSYFLKKAAKLESGSSATKKETAVGKITKEQCYEIAKTKLPDLNTDNVDAAYRIIRGSAESMGIDIIEN